MGIVAPNLHKDIPSPDFNAYRDPGVLQEGKIMVHIGIIRLSCSRVDVLIGIALLPFDSDAEQRVMAVAGTLQVIPCKDAQASGIELDLAFDGIFHAKISDLGKTVIHGLSPRFISFSPIMRIAHGIY
jgi:hypothetical protein